MKAFYEFDDANAFDPADVVVRCIENSGRALLLDCDALPPEFFDLSTGVAGELLHKLGNYRLRLAAVVADPSVHSARFQDFHRETNKGRQFRFFATRQEATDWLEATGE